jgi:hypothetical protein
MWGNDHESVFNVDISDCPRRFSGNAKTVLHIFSKTATFLCAFSYSVLDVLVGKNFHGSSDVRNFKSLQTSLFQAM